MRMRRQAGPRTTPAVPASAGSGRTRKHHPHARSDEVRARGAQPGDQEAPLAKVACTTLYLDDAEWQLLRFLPARGLTKTRHLVERAGRRIAIDELQDSTLLAEFDEVGTPALPVAAWLDVIEDVSHDEAWTGAALAR